MLCCSLHSSVRSWRELTSTSHIVIHCVLSDVGAPALFIGLSDQRAMVWHLYFPVNLSSLEVFLSLYCFKLYAFISDWSILLAFPARTVWQQLLVYLRLSSLQPPLQRPFVLRTEFLTDIPFSVSHFGCVCVWHAASFRLS